MSSSERERLAGAVLCTGFDGTLADRAVLEAVHALAPGGLLLFARNTPDVDATRALVDDLVRACDRPPYIAIDQEGGRVARLRAGTTEIPAMLALGACDDPALARRAGAQIGRDLRRAGVTLDFAPVLDLAVDPENLAIGSRAFGADPLRVATLATAFAQGMRGAGVRTTGKHLPGHGATSVDSHLALPIVERSIAQLRAGELLPYRTALAAGALDALMVGHLVVPALDPDAAATVSPRAVAFVRTELGYDGPLVTDAIEMRALADRYGVERAAVLALHAGIDGVVLGTGLADARRVRDAIVVALEAGELSEARLHEAARRLAPLATPLEASGDANADREIGREIARCAVTAVRGTLALDRDRAATVVSFEGEIADGAGETSHERPSLALALRRRRVRSEIMRVPLEPDDGDLLLLESVLGAQGDRNFVFLMRRAHVYPAQRRALARLLARFPDARVVSVREPFDLAAVPAARHLGCTYGDEEVSLEALADVLAGLHPATGRLPVSIDAVAAH